MLKMRLWMILIVFITQVSFANDFSIISYNIDGHFFKKQKKGIDNIIRTIGYYQANTHLYQNTFNRYSDSLKHSNIHQYFSYDDGVKKRTSSIETTEFPIQSEQFLPFKYCFSFWKNFGVKNIRLSLNDYHLDLYNASFPKQKKKYLWENILEMEKFIKRNSMNDDFILAIEFNQTSNREEILLYLKEKLNLTIIPAHYSPNIETKDRTITGSNVLLIRSNKLEFNFIESYPVFDGAHDENLYLKNSGTLYRFSY